MLFVALFFVDLPGQRQEPTLTLTPTPTATLDPTANWQIYRNEEFGFEVKYPGDWYFREFPIAVGFDPKPISDDFAGVIEILMLKDTSLEESLELIGASVFNQEIIEIDGFKAVRVTGEFTDIYNETYEPLQVHIEKGNTVYRLKPNRPDFKDIFSQILSTFKFTR